MATRADTARYTDVPGIVIVDGPAGARARIQGTGVEVFEVIKMFRVVDGSRDELIAEYDGDLKPEQLDAALTYYAKHTEEIETRLGIEDGLARAIGAV